MATTNKEILKELLNAPPSKNGSAKPEQTEFKVERSKDYAKFTFLQGNRVVNPLVVKRITASMQKRHLFSPVIVNEKFQIIDGQHRFLSCKELKLPFYYIVVEGYDVEEVHILNTNGSNWKKLDYLQGYADLGMRPYIQVKEFMEQFPDFGIQAALQLLKSNAHAHKLHTRLKTFEDGLLTIGNLDHSRALAKKIMDYAPFYKGYAKVTFVIACLQIMEHKNYDHERMLNKLSARVDLITDQTKAVTYVVMLEDVFNWHSSKRFSLRY